MHNAYPTPNTHPGNPGQFEPTSVLSPESPEEAYRQKLAEDIVAASVGTVGMFTKMELSSQEKADMRQAYTDRNPDLQPDASNSAFTETNGWSNYGDRMLGREGQDPLKPVITEMVRGRENYGNSAEELHFIDLPDGRVDVRYGFTAYDFQDFSGRTGNIVVMGFKLPKEGAQALLEAGQSDPSFIRDVVRTQAAAIGISGEKWKDQAEPRGVDSNSHSLRLVGHNPADGSIVHTETIAYSKHESIAPARPVQQPVPQAEYIPPAPVEQVLPVAVEYQQPLAAESQTSPAYEAARADAQLMLEVLEDASPAEQMAHLADTASSKFAQGLNAEMVGDTAAAQQAADAEHAYREAYLQVLQKMVATHDGEEAFVYQDQLAALYKSAALASGKQPGELSAVAAVAYDPTPSLARDRAYQLMVFNEALAKVSV